MSATPDSTLANPEQLIADLQRQLSEREAELAEAHERETATAEVLQVINTSPGELKPVFDAILAKAHSLFGVEYGVLLIYDGELLWPVAMNGAPPSLEVRNGFRPSSGFRALLRGERLLHIHDMAEFAAQRPEEPVYRDLFESGGIRTQLAVPLRKDGRLLGIITANRREVRPFSYKQIALLENFAAQAVIAMENARLLTETREALEQQTATTEVLQVINSSPGDLAPVFDAMLERAIRLCTPAFGVLFSWDGERFHRVAWRGGSEETIEGSHGAVIPPPGSPGYRLVQGENSVSIADLAADEIARTTPVQYLLRFGARSYVTVALRKEVRLLGMLTVYRQEVRPFTDKEIALLQNFAAQAVIAMENARLIIETREALEQQTATAEVLQVINSSPGQLMPVFDAMLDKAVRLCEADFGIMLTVNGEASRIVAERDVPEPLSAFLSQHLPDVGPDTFFGRAVIGRAVLHTADMREEAAYHTGQPLTLAAVDNAGVRALLMAPLLKDDGVLGVFAIFRREPRPFSDKQIALLQNFAAQAVIAMENARLLTETREALEQQTATAEVLGVINSSPGDLAPVFDAVLGKALRLCDAAFGHLLTFDGERFGSAAVHGDQRLVEHLRQRGPLRTPTDGVSLLGRIVVGGEHIVQSADLLETKEYHTAPHFREFVDIGGYRSLLNVALRKEKVLFGVIVICRKEVRPFSDKQIALLENFAAQAVIAMENARLLTETRDALEQQTATAEVLQVINSSPGNLSLVFEAMLEKVTRLCEAPFGILRTWDGECFHFGAVHGEPTFRDWIRQRGPTRPDRDASPLGRIQAGERVVRFADEPGDEGYWNSAGFREMVEASGIRRGIWVALRKDDKLLGTITVYRREPRPFSEKQVALLENFAAQAVIAMENARLLGELRQRTEEISELNRGLEARVAEQVDELGRVGRLKRFLAPQLAEMIVSHGDENILESHRREIVVVFCDLRGYTAFTETAEPEEVLDFLREYHGALGPLVSQFEGTLDQFSGDGIMVFFNDPVPCPNPAERAVQMAMAMREAAGTLISAWRRRGRALGFGAGIAQGYATLGQIGFADRSGYTAIGTVCNLAARLCAEAQDGQILVAQRVAVAVEEITPLEEVGELNLKGLTQPALRLIEGGPQSV